MPYTEKPDVGDVLTKEDFFEGCEDGMFIDYDGYGYPMLNGLSDTGITIRPSNHKTKWPDDATHIEWFNK